MLGRWTLPSSMGRPASPQIRLLGWRTKVAAGPDHQTSRASKRRYNIRAHTCLCLFARRLSRKQEKTQSQCSGFPALLPHSFLVTTDIFFFPLPLILSQVSNSGGVRNPTRESVFLSPNSSLPSVGFQGPCENGARRSILVEESRPKFGSFEDARAVLPDPSVVLPLRVLNGLGQGG